MTSNAYLEPLAALAARQRAVVVPDGAAVTVLNAALDQQAARSAAPRWEPPSVRSWRQQLAHTFDESMLLSGGDDVAELVLSPDQETALWRQVVDADRRYEIATPERAALAAREAWLLQHVYDMPPVVAEAALTDDVSAFRGWAAAYRRRTAELGAIEPARLLARAARGDSGHTDSGDNALQVHGFAATPHAIDRWLARCSATPANVMPAATDRVTGHAYADRETELRQAIDWAATRARDGGRVAVVFERLGQEAALVRRCIADVLGRDALAAGSGVFPGAPESLAERPAMRLLRLVIGLGDVCAWRELSALVRHPLLAGAEAEAAARDRLDLWLRQTDRDEIPWTVLQQACDGTACAGLAAIIIALRTRRDAQPARQLASAWFEHFDDCLRVAGWPDYPRPERIDQQLLRAWGEAGDRVSALDLVLPPLTRAAAVALVERILGEATAPLHGAASLYLVTPAEALLIEPEALWLCGCEASWLLERNRTTPLLPLDQQRQAAVPGAVPARDLEHARQLFALLVANGREIHASYAVGEGDLRLMPSSLLPQLAALKPTPVAEFVPRDWRLAPVTCDRVDDPRGPVWDGAAIGGGVGVISAQGECPFRAFARYRLDATAPPDPAPGISALDKGSVVHRALAALWEQLGDSTALAQLSDAARQAQIRAVVAAVLKPPPEASALELALVRAERERLAALLDAWLAFEREREPFSIVACEAEVNLQAGALALRARVDRVEQREDGRVIIVDYKTGVVSASVWDTPRMRDAQLPLYALCGNWEPGGVALAEVRADKPRWVEWPGPKDSSEDWQQTLSDWRQDIQAQAAGFIAGEALVDPKRGASTCRYCEQLALCRRHELAGLASDADDDDEYGDDDAAG